MYVCAFVCVCVCVCACVHVMCIWCKVSRMFEGKEFCVINGPRGLSKEEMERKIAEVGRYGLLCITLAITNSIQV